MTGRILCLGDSLTYGFGLPRGLVWTALCAAQTGAELLGGGVNGNTTGGMLAVLPDLLVREHPDAVLLMGGTNDIAYGGDLAGARANMGAMAHLIIAGGGLPLIGIPPGLRRPIRREWAELMPERAAELLYKEGIYHFSNEGVCSWYDFAKEICDLSGNVCDIQPCHSDEFPSKVKRPHFSVLDKTKVKSTFGITVPYWKDSLQKCIHELKQQSAY